MVGNLRNIDQQLHDLAEFAVAIVRIVLGMVVLVLGLIVVDIVVYLSIVGSSYDEKIVAAYGRSYDAGYAQAYAEAYHQTYTEAYERGYDKEYTLGLRADAPEKTATRVALRNPTYEELRRFLTRDKTDTHPYILNEYVSFDFAVELNGNAEREGIRAAFVTVIFPEKSHGVVAFETTDRGLIFIEPQSDVEVAVLVGQSYWHSATRLIPTYYDDTIVDIQLFW